MGGVWKATRPRAQNAASARFFRLRARPVNETIIATAAPKQT
jgi:hypothetical protein